MTQLIVSGLVLDVLAIVLLIGATRLALSRPPVEAATFVTPRPKSEAPAQTQSWGYHAGAALLVAIVVGGVLLLFVALATWHT